MKQIRKFLLIFAAVFCIIAPASFAYGASQTYTLTFDSNCNNDSSYTTSITTKAVAQGDSYGVYQRPHEKVMLLMDGIRQPQAARPYLPLLQWGQAMQRFTRIGQLTQSL